MREQEIGDAGLEIEGEMYANHIVYVCKDEDEYYRDRPFT